MDLNTARTISQLLLDVSGELDESVRVAKDGCSLEEFLSYRRAVAGIMHSILLEILNPLFREHPELTPEGLIAPEAGPACGTNK
jgi:hypothetical protein